MKIVIIGFGSIGQRHYRILSKIYDPKKIFVLTKQSIKIKNKLKNLNDIIKFNPDYIIISSENYKHYNQLKFLEKNLYGKKILVEKPLFHKNLKLKIERNKVYVGYNLRFHPLLIKLREILKNKKIIDFKVITNSYLPNWRKNIVYSKNFTAFKEKGGGIILDLSHEIDILTWFEKKIKFFYSSYSKLSNLKMNTEDNLKLIGKFKNSNFYLDLNYFSRNELRYFFIDTNNLSINLDLIRNNLIISNGKKKKFIKVKIDRNFTYIKMHNAILRNKDKNLLCTYKEGTRVMKLIHQIKNLNS